MMMPRTRATAFAGRVRSVTRALVLAAGRMVAPRTATPQASAPAMSRMAVAATRPYRTTAPASTSWLPAATGVTTSRIKSAAMALAPPSAVAR